MIKQRFMRLAAVPIALSLLLATAGMVAAQEPVATSVGFSQKLLPAVFAVRCYDLLRQ